MSPRNQQIAVWLALPLLGLLMIVGVITVWGAAYIIAPIVLLLGIAVVAVMLSRRADG